MGKKANAKRKELFRQLEEDGKLDRPVVKVKKEQARANRPVVRPSKSTVILQPQSRVTRKPTYMCCIDKYGDGLPSGFRPCIDCPGPSLPEEATASEAA